MLQARKVVRLELQTPPPIGVVGKLTCPEGLPLCVAITHDRVGLKTVLTPVLLFCKN